MKQRVFNSTLILVITTMMWSVQLVASDDPGGRLTRQQYIDAWKDEAIAHMHKYGIPASIKLAQGILESGDGNSMLARKANNHFGIKCHGWNGPGVYKDDDAKNECFRKYKNARESFEDHSQFLLKPRYTELFKLKSTDYKGWAHGLKKAGYATNPKYPQLLIRIIEENDLHRFDRAGQGKGRVAQSKPAPQTSKPASGKGGEIDFHLGRQILQTDNRAQFVFAREGDTYKGIADDLQMNKWQLQKYNEDKSVRTLAEGERVYIKPKRNRAAGASVHVVEEGQTLWDISQLHAVKLSRLERYNELTRDTPLRKGMQIKLSRR